MGRMMRVACASCGKDWQCMTGCGLSHALLENVVREFPKDVRERVMRENREECSVFEFGYRISVCGDCGNIVSVPVLKFEERDTEYIGPCPKCKAAVPLPADRKEMVCPVCGNKTLIEEETGRWD